MPRESRKSFRHLIGDEDVSTSPIVNVRSAAAGDLPLPERCQIFCTQADGAFRWQFLTSRSVLEHLNGFPEANWADFHFGTVFANWKIGGARKK